MPHNIPPTPPPKKRQSFFKKNYSLNDTGHKAHNGTAQDLSVPHGQPAPQPTTTVSIHRSQPNDYHSMVVEGGAHANGMHNRIHNNNSHSTNKTPQISSTSVNPSIRHDVHSPVRIAGTNESWKEVTLKQQNRAIGDNYLLNAWRKYQFIDSLLYAFSGSDNETSIPLPAHKIMLQNYSGYCRKFFSFYQASADVLVKGFEYVGEKFQNVDNDNQQMTWFNIQRLSGSQTPVISVPIPFYDLLKLVTLMYTGEVKIDRKNLDSIQKSALILKMTSIEIVELREMLVNPNGIAPSMNFQLVESSVELSDNHPSKSGCTLSCGNCCYSSNRTSTSSPELNITAVSPSPPLTAVVPSTSIERSIDLRTSLQTAPITFMSAPIEQMGVLAPKPKLPPPPPPSHHQQQQQPPETTRLNHTLADFLYNRLNSVHPYIADLMTPPITPSTAGTSCSSGSSSSASQYPATPSIMSQNPFFTSSLISNFLSSSQMINRQLSAPATLATPIDEHSSSPIFMSNHSKSASADEASSPPSLNGTPNRKRTQNLVHAAQYRDRRRQKIEQLYAEKDKEEAKKHEQRNIIQKLCGQIEKLIDSQTRSGGDDSNTYRCPICSQSFGQLSTIRMHLNTAHPERTSPSGPLANAVVDPVSGQLHLRPPFRNSEREKQTIQDWIDAQRIAQDNFFSQQQSKQQQTKSLLAHGHSSSMIIS